MVWPHALTRHFQAQVIQARERAQVRAIKGSIGHVEVFQMDGVGISIIERPDPYPATTRPTPPTTPTPPNAKIRKTCETRAETFNMLQKGCYSVAYSSARHLWKFRSAMLVFETLPAELAGLFLAWRS